MNLIGISGYMGSGKDTVGAIIQDLTKGIDPTFDIMMDGKLTKWTNHPNQSRWRINKYAFKLKKIASILTGIEQYKFEDQEFKKTSLPSVWSYQYTIPFSGPDHTVVEMEMTVREFLQKLGTEAMRDGLHKDVWINALFAEYKEHSRWIITDCRFPNEAQAIKDRGGVIVRVHRHPVDLTTSLHASETSLDDWCFDYHLHNDSNIDVLRGNVAGMLSDFGIKMSEI